MSESLTVSDVRALTMIVDACAAGARVRWLTEHGDVTDGIARCIAHEGGRFAGPDDDVRDLFVHVSGMLERWLPVREVMAMIEAATFAVDQ